MLPNRSDSASSEERLNQVIADYLEAEEAGRAPDPAGLLADHPDLAGALSAFLRDRQQFAQAAQQLPTPPAGPDATQSTGTAPGPQIEGFEVVRELGRGGMGVVYLARQLQPDRLVALKLLRAADQADEAELARFRLEAETLARLRHPNIVQIHVVGEHDGRPFLALEYIAGGTLADKVQESLPTPAAAAAQVETLARAMHAAHERGVVHRDLKPENVLLDSDGTPKITDFGLAKKLDASGQTASNAVVGTPSYMAPEQAGGQSRLVGPAADVYALGAILYKLLTGRPPFQGPTTMDILLQVVSADPVPPRRLRPEVPRDLQTICLKCLAKVPGERYADGLALAEDLRRCRAGEPIQARPAGRAEQLVKWARRRPALAAAYGLGLLALLLGSGGIGALGLWQRAEKAREELLLVSYFRAMDLAHRDCQDDKFERAHRCLQDYPERVRGWEWHYLWRLSHPRTLLTLKGHAYTVMSVSFSPDGHRLASASDDWTVKVWGAHTGQEERTLKGHTGSVFAVSFSPDDRHLASASADGTVKVWDAQTGREERTLKGHTGGVQGVSFSPDGRRLASAGGNFHGPGEVKVWNAQTGQEERTLQGHKPGAEDVSFSPDGRRLASISLDGTVKVWDALTGQEVLTLRGGSSRMAFSPDGRRLASASWDNTVKVWDAHTGQEIHSLKGHTKEVRSVSFSPDGRRLASASFDRTVKVWDAQTGQLALSLEGHTGAVWGVAFSPDGRLASAGGSWSAGEVKVWAQPGQEILPLKGHTGAVWGVDFSPDGRRLASASQDKTVKIWDAQTGQEILTLKGHTGAVRGVSFSPDGRRLASASDDHTVLWDAQTGREIRTFKGHSGFPGVYFRPDGRLVGASEDGTWVMVWDAQPGQEILKRKGHTNFVSRVAYSPDGRRSASAWDTTVTVEDPQTRQTVLSLQGHAGTFFGVAFSPDGRRLASASQDKTVKIWDAQTGQEILTLKGHTGAVRGVAFSPDGWRLASASEDGTVRVWDATPLPGDAAPPAGLKP
jgi:WD40 repeat protein